MVTDEDCAMDPWSLIDDIVAVSPLKATSTLDDMEDELLVGPDNFSQPHREFNLLQDDFLDLAGDDDADHNEMALSLASNSAVTAAVSVTNGVHVVANESFKEADNFITCHPDNSVQEMNNLDSWEQDVLLSNAGLPETNPLLLDEDLDHTVGEDFQKMLNDWENHIGSLQGSDMPDVDMSTLVPNEVPASSSGGPSATVNVIKTETMDMEDEEMQEDNKPKQQLTTIRDEQGGGKMTLGQMALAGIVISSGPGDYFETYEVASAAAAARSCTTTTSSVYQRPLMSRPTIVPLRDELERGKASKESSNIAVLEATDADNLLEQFEEITPDLNDDDQHTSNGKTSNIFKAVQNHFAASAAAASNNNSGCRRLPRIVPSQRIKDAIPREIIERIKASSQKSRTIAIIEPVNNKPDSKAQTASSNSVASSNIQVQVGNMINKPSIISKSHVIQPASAPAAARHTRFAEAANSLHKTKTLRLISTASSAASSASAASPQQVQISLDHDYCSSSSKMKRNRPLLTASTASRPLIRLQPTSVSKPSSIVVSSPMTSKSIVRVSPPVSASAASTNVTESVITMPIAVEVSAAASNAMASSPLSSPARKDSGLESGEASDTSESQHATSASSLDLYSKVPNYLTSVSVQNADSRSVAPAEEDAKSYDRLPAYVKGVPKRISTSSRTTSTDCPSSIVVSSASSTPDPNPVTTPVISRMRTRQMRSRSSSCSNSSSDSNDKTDRMATRSRTSAANSGPSSGSSPGSSAAARRRRQSSSSSSSSSTDLRSSRQHQHKKRRSWRKQYSSDRSRSPQHRHRTSSKQQRQVEERRVVYVGRISEGTTRADLRKRFQVFGPVEEISVHFRDRGDNYGFITFLNKKDAFSAIEHGNDDTSNPKVDLCFGGRRAFCKEKYADLDSGPSESRRNRYAGKSMIMMQMPPSSPRSNEEDEVDSIEDFDALLKQARAGIRKS